MRILKFFANLSEEPNGAFLSFLPFDGCHLAVPTMVLRLAACLTTGPCHMAWVLCWLVVTLSHCSGEKLTGAAGVNDSYITQDQEQESQSSEGFHGGLVQS